MQSPRTSPDPIRTRRMRVIGHLVLATLAALSAPGLAASGGRADEGWAAADGWDAQISMLLEAQGAGAQRSAAAALASIGPEAVPAMLAILAQGSLPRAGGGDPVSLAAGQRQDILRALELHGPGRVLPFLEVLLEGEAEERELAVALEVFGRVGRVADAPLGFRLAERGMREELLPLRLQQALSRALDGQLDRFPEALGAYAGAAMRQPEAVLSLVARAIGRRESHAALLTLGDLLGRGERLDVLLLSDMERCALGSASAVPARTSMAVRRLLEANEPTVAAQAARTVRAIGDMAAVSKLIDLLDDRDPGVVSNAHGALCSLAGASLAPDAASWRAWQQEQLEWWRSEEPVLLRALRSGAPAKRAQALESLARGRLVRDEISEHVTALLSDRQPGIPQLACVVLGSLQARSALPELERLLDAEDPTLADAARAAVQRIASGRPLRREPRRRAGPPRLDVPASVPAADSTR